MEALCDWIVMEGYFNNHDVAGNIRYVRGDGTGGMWRICLFDFDLALQNASCNFDRVFEQVNPDRAGGLLPDGQPPIPRSFAGTDILAAA